MEAQLRERRQQLVTFLYESSLEGNVNSLLNLLEEDPRILDRAIIEKSDRFIQSPLHIAVNFGHLDFVKVILAKNTKMCFAKDRYGRNPVHVAVMSGEVDVLKALVSANPLAARELTSDGTSNTVLHLGVKYSQPTVVKVIMEEALYDELLNSKDSDGNTALHLAVIAKQLQMIQYLVTNPRTEKNARNTEGLTALDISNRSNKGRDDGEIWRVLRRAKALSAKGMLLKSTSNKNNHEWLERERTALMVVASLIATMAFQIAINPPGGIWQEGIRLDNRSIVGEWNVTDNNSTIPYVGTSVMVDVSHTQFDKLLVSNTIAFLASLSVIMLLISGLPCKRLFVFVLMVVMWIAITATALTYFLSLAFLSAVVKGDDQEKTSVVINTIGISCSIWVCLMLILFLGHGFRAIRKPIKRFIIIPAYNLVKFIVNGCKMGESSTPPV